MHFTLISHIEIFLFVQDHGKPINKANNSTLDGSESWAHNGWGMWHHNISYHSTESLLSSWQDKIRVSEDDEAQLILLGSYSYWMYSAWKLKPVPVSLGNTFCTRSIQKESDLIFSHQNQCHKSFWVCVKFFKMVGSVSSQLLGQEWCAHIRVSFVSMQNNQMHWAEMFN